jgi:hypothetical protein
MAEEALFAIGGQPVTSNLGAAAMTTGDLICNHQDECTTPLPLEPLPMSEGYGEGKFLFRPKFSAPCNRFIFNKYLIRIMQHSGRKTRNWYSSQKVRHIRGLESRFLRSKTPKASLLTNGIVMPEVSMAFVVSEGLWVISA